jgi:hypothetical protein
MTWLPVGGIGSTTAAWRGYNNAAVSDGATLSSVLLSTADTVATYEEENDSSTNPNAVSANNEGEWDWVLEHNATAGTSYCFRTITAQGETLDEYDRYPALVTNRKPNTPTIEAPFDNEQLASTTPWFEFTSEDAEGNDVTYQVQIDDDTTFASPVIDRDSQTNFTEFSNVVTPADKDPFTSGQTVRFVPTTALTNGTTYYWRVRGKDRNASATWSDWSSTYSVTINTGTTITTWYQTTAEQFATDAFDDTEVSGNDIILTTGFTPGTTTGTAVDFDDRTTGNAWGSLSWNDNETTGDIRYRIEYLAGSTWTLVPDADLPGNSSGFGTGPVSLLSLSPTTYNQIRVRANLTNIGGTPRLLDWTIAWGLAVEQPTQYTLFDNEKTGTTTPTFTFESSDPQNNDLVYELSISTSPSFTASTTRTSNIHGGFTNTASSTDTSPFVSGDRMQFKVQVADALTNNTTYWWRVRAKDPSGGDVWSVWSPSRSFTVDTAITVSTWFQTTDDQFSTDTLTDTEISGSNSVRVSTVRREAFVAYAESTVQAPRYRLWNGTTWAAEGTALSIGAPIYWVEAAAAPTRDEYIIVTMASTGRVDAQVFNGTTNTWGNKVQIGTASNNLRRGFDIAYETTSGDAVVVSCMGTEAAYRVWNGSSWDVSTSSITLSVTNNCEWVKLASDPTSDEMIMVARDTTAGATDYQALVWSGSAWANSSTFGSQVTAANEGIAIEYEESGGQAVVAVSNGANNNFIYNTWNGTIWQGTNTVTTGNDFAAGRLARDSGSDELGMCYIDIDGDIGYVEWSGSAWPTAFAEIELTGNSINGRPVSCEFETSAGRDNFVMIPYSDDINARYQYFNGTTPSGEADVSTITDSWEIRSVRTGDGNILAVAYDDANTEYDFSYWNGTSWSTEEVLETSSITTTAPATVPIDIVERRYPSFTSGTLTSDSVVFSDGSGPKWQSMSWNDTTPGSSDILYAVEYYASTTDTWARIPDSAIPGNSVGTTTSPIDLSNISRTTYNTIRAVADLTCVGGNCPSVNDWTVAWSEGIVVSGTAQAYNQSTNVTSGTVAVAVNGVLQTGKTATISSGTWSIPNVTVFENDIVTVFIDGAADSAEAAAVLVYDGTGDITGVNLYERHLTLGSADNQTITNANIGQYDNSVSGDEDVFFDVDAGNDLAACAAAVTGCADVEIVVKASNTYRPDSTSSGNVTTHDIEINGTVTADNNTFYIGGSWDNNSVFTKGVSTVVFTATSTTETIDSTGATTANFNAVTFGQTSGATPSRTRSSSRSTAPRRTRAARTSRRPTRARTSRQRRSSRCRGARTRRAR